MAGPWLRPVVVYRARFGGRTRYLVAPPGRTTSTDVHGCGAADVVFLLSPPPLP
mgnify:CR=1 FL=1